MPVKSLPAPTQEERDSARAAAVALRTAIADPTTMGAPGLMHVDMGRPRRGVWFKTWANLPGFLRGSDGYSHCCLPGWIYTRAEIRAEMILDLEALAERGERPAEATR